MSPPFGMGVASNYDEKELGKVFDMGLARRMSRYLGPYRGYVALAVFLAILSAFFRVVSPLIAREVINRFMPPETPEASHGLHVALWSYFGLLILIFVTNFVQSYITAWVGQHAMHDLRGEIFRKLHRLSMRFFDRTPSGRLLTRATSDVSVLNEMFGQGIVQIFTDLALIVGIIIVWFRFDWRLAILLLFTVPLLGVASYNFRIRARTAYRAVRQRIAVLNSFLQENLAGIRTVQAFARTERNKTRYAELNAPYRDAQIETVRQFALFFPLVQYIQVLAISTVLAYGAWEVSRATNLAGGRISFGDFHLYFQYISWFFMPISSLAERYNIFQGAMASAERIFALLDEKEEVTDRADPAPVNALESGVELRNVSFAYNPNDWVLRDVSLKVGKGTTVALVGATGAGKSTVINLVSRLYDVDEGAVLYNGRDVREFSQAELRRRMAIVLQDVFLFSGTIADNIRLGSPHISDKQVERAARHVNAHEFISRLPKGYESEVLERGATLSTGQKQLLAFARAVAFDPELLILDEATANIDTETEALIQDALDRLMRERTCIVVAHRLSTIQNADRIAVFHHGEIREEGTHQELLAKGGLYRRLYELQYRT